MNETLIWRRSEGFSSRRLACRASAHLVSSEYNLWSWLPESSIGERSLNWAVWTVSTTQPISLQISHSISMAFMTTATGEERVNAAVICFKSAICVCRTEMFWEFGHVISTKHFCSLIVDCGDCRVPWRSQKGLGEEGEEEIGDSGSKFLWPEIDGLRQYLS